MPLRSPFSADALRLTILAALGAPEVAACQASDDDTANTRITHATDSDAGNDTSEPRDAEPTDSEPTDDNPAPSEPEPGEGPTDDSQEGGNSGSPNGDDSSAGRGGTPSQLSMGGSPSSMGGSPPSTGGATSVGGGFAAVGGSTSMGGAASGGGATSAGGSSVGGTSSGGSGGSASGALCTNPVPLVAEYDSGYFSCDEGYQHRAESKECASILPRPDVLPPNGSLDAGSLDECWQDSDCPGPHGYCEREDPGELGGYGEAYNACRQGCTVDADCDTGMACLCGGFVGLCVPAGCRTDADCEGDSLCVNVPGMSCGNGFDLDCLHPLDECRSSNDCSYDTECDNAATGERRTCGPIAVCGRPFLVGFAERRAQPSPRADYAGETPIPSVTDLDTAVRAALADHWTDIGLMEHASIAAFARFTLQLLGCGAPPSLIEASNRALADETRHARLCFSLASHYRAAPVGPGPLEMAGALDQTSLEDVLRMVIREGCIGETQAALEADEARFSCEDPSVAEVLSVIAQDEARHAELAWRFVSWLLEQRPDLSAVAREEFGSVGVAQLAAKDGVEPNLARFGVLDATTRHKVREHALSRVVKPCAERLLASRRVAASELRA